MHVSAILPPWVCCLALTGLWLACIRQANADASVAITGPDSTLIAPGTGTNDVWVQVTLNPAVPGATCSISLYDYGTSSPVLYSGTAAVPDSTPTSAQIVQIPVNVAELGIYNLHAQVIDASGAILATADSTYAVVPARTVVGPDFMGVCTHLSSSASQPAPRILDLVKLAGFARVRDNFWWDSIEPTPGNYTFSSWLSNLVSDAGSRGLKVLGILGISTPAYTFPKGQPTAATDAAFAKYAAQCMRQFPSLDDWEIINEPNDYNPTTVYAPLLETVYPAMKAVRSSVNVISCGGAGAGGNATGQYETAVLNAGGIAYQDSFSVHPYMAPYTPEDGYSGSGGPVAAVNIPTIWPYLTTLATKNPNPTDDFLAVWITEIGWTNDAGGITEMQQAAYLVRTYLLAAKQGFATIQHVFWYDFQNDGTTTTSEQNFGLIRADYSAKPAYVAAAVFSSTVGDTSFNQSLVDTETVKVYQYGNTYVAWAINDPSPITFPLPEGTYILRDWQGRDSAITSTGSFTLTAGINPQYILPAPPLPPATLPIINSATSAGLQIGQSFTYQITASGNPTSYAAIGLPPGTVIDTGSGLISGTPTQVGTYSIGLSATNSAGTGVATLSLTITTAPIDAPAINSVLSATAQSGQPFSYQITATNNPTSYSVSGLPASLGVDAASGVISGTLVTSGTFSVGLSAKNALGIGTATLVLTVSPASAVAPVITSALTTQDQVGQPFQYQLAAANAPTSFGASGLPTGLSIDPETGIIDGTPTLSGTFNVVLNAVNAGGTGTAALTLTVTPTPLVATLIATVTEVTVGSGKVAAFTVTLSAPQSSAVVVRYKVGGSARNGTDYALLSGTKKIKPGKLTRTITIVPRGDLDDATKRVVKLTLLPGSGYAVGTGGAVKIKLLNSK